MLKIDEIPVLLVGYNRFNLFQKNFYHLHKFGLKNIYIFIDGPKSNIRDKIEHTKILDFLNEHSLSQSPCTKIEENNLGCRDGVTAAINFFFEHNNFGIIVEDDVFIETNYLNFVLNMYHLHNEREDILAISSNSFKVKSNNSLDPYFYSKVPRIWGWATWKKTWNLYDKHLLDWKPTDWPDWFKNHFYLNELEKDYWAKKFNLIVENKIDTWDIQLTYMSFKFNLININPTSNLSKNRGIGLKATHTKNFFNRPKLRKRTNYAPIYNKLPVEYNNDYDIELMK